VLGGWHARRPASPHRPPYWTPPPLSPSTHTPFGPAGCLTRGDTCRPRCPPIAHEATTPACGPSSAHYKHPCCPPPAPWARPAHRQDPGPALPTASTLGPPCPPPAPWARPAHHQNQVVHGSADVGPRARLHQARKVTAADWRLEQPRDRLGRAARREAAGLWAESPPPRGQAAHCTRRAMGVRPRDRAAWAHWSEGRGHACSLRGFLWRRARARAAALTAARGAAVCWSGAAAGRSPPPAAGGPASSVAPSSRSKELSVLPSGSVPPAAARGEAARPGRRLGAAPSASGTRRRSGAAGRRRS
jgi:hypothetical protein